MGSKTFGASSVSQQAALAALEGPKDFFHERRAVFQLRRDLMVTLLNDRPGLECVTPAGVIVCVRLCAGLIRRTSSAGRVLHTDENVAHALLDEASVALVHGRAFGLVPIFVLPTPWITLHCARLVRPSELSAQLHVNSLLNEEKPELGRFLFIHTSVRAKRRWLGKSRCRYCSSAFRSKLSSRPILKRLSSHAM